ncbi:glycosyltransferase family 9 protein [Carboxylicivirga linearis]|uniref:Glycosyltransferase family 9 protein n=1 Tax=Carboxylicivirga linearis TaxID=1628157 RepID=A0ABS5JPW5_9BACT|nr:glycosyltransferase family 9 protein [Carboxylicivirga linearis]MBS2096807.1 glycosyltransferase family 9 protein [Carboxylicivirga linearis]
MDKILIIRLSSIGDIIQCMSVVTGIRNKYPNAEIHWVVRSDMASLVKIDPRIDKLWEFDRKEGFSGVFKLGAKLKKEKYDLIYDAHSNIRSNILKLVLCPFGICNLLKKNKLVTRHKDRLKRLLLFKFGINLLPNPFKALDSFRKPIQSKWDINDINTPFSNWKFPDNVQSKIEQLVLNQIPGNQKWITLVPSAAWELKRWPVNYWQKLIELKPDLHFVILGGPTDTFCEEIRSVAPDRVINLAGKTSLMESFCTIWHSPFVISGDTGFLHAADLFQKPGLAIIGPTAFGYPSGDKIKVMEVDLPCRPCTKDGSTKCKLKEIKKCLTDLTPEILASNIPNL